MKRILAIAVMLVMIFSLTACGDDSPTASKPKDENKPSTTTSTETQSSDKTDSAPQTTVSYITSEITTTKPNSNLPANVDRSWHENPAALCFSVSGELDDDADEMRAEILAHTEQSVTITGTTYYVSQNGKDTNNGKSPKTAWVSLDAVEKNSAQFKSGDAVLFERGGVFRGNINLQSGVYYGAYGTGDRPCIYGSAKNYATSKWIEVGQNVWRLSERFSSDVGVMVFNHGEAVGIQKDSRSDIKENFDFYCDRNNNNRIYLYLDEDPNGLFVSVEIGINKTIFLFDGKKDITVENLCFKYTGGHAVRGGGTENVTVRYCEIGYIGGSFLSSGVRYGNGVELIGNSKNSLVENNWIYQIYDSGITHQGDRCVVENFVAKGNLVEFCGMGAIEYWHTKGAVMKNVLYTENMLRFSGYGFGGLLRPDKNMCAAIQSNGKSTGTGYNEAENFIIRNNIFEFGTYQLINATSGAGTPPKFDGNTYIQVSGKWLGYYEDNTNIRFNTSATAIIKNTWGDANAQIVFK